MVFKLDLSDMERRACELRLFLQKEFRRFAEAEMADQYERIVKTILDKEFGRSDQAENVIRIEHIGCDSDARQLSSFLERLVISCLRPEQHKLLQATLRESLQESRRRSIIDHHGDQVEPMCFFCGSDSNPPAVNHQQNDPADLHLINNWVRNCLIQNLDRAPATPPPSICPPIVQPQQQVTSASASPQSPLPPSAERATDERAQDLSCAAQGAELQEEAINLSPEVPSVATRQGEGPTTTTNASTTERPQTTVDWRPAPAARGSGVANEPTTNDDEADRSTDIQVDNSSSFQQTTEATNTSQQDNRDEVQPDCHEDSFHEWFNDLNDRPQPISPEFSPSSDEDEEKGKEGFRQPSGDGSPAKVKAGEALIALVKKQSSQGTNVKGNKKAGNKRSGFSQPANSKRLKKQPEPSSVVESSTSTAATTRAPTSSSLSLSQPQAQTSQPTQKQTAKARTAGIRIKTRPHRVGSQKGR